MKKLFVAVLCFIMVFAFCSCGEKDTQAGGNENKTNDSGVAENISESTEKSSSGFAANLSMSVASSSVKAGDEVTVTLNISGAENLACFDVYIEAGDSLECVKYKTKSVPDFTLEIARVDLDGKLKLSGYTMYTYDFDNEEVCEVTYKIPDSAQSGKEYHITLSPIEFQSGTDKDGAKLIDITDSVTSNELVLTVQ